MKKIIVAFIIISVVFILWISESGRSLNKCFLDVSEKYKNYPAQYASGLLPKTDFEQIFLNLKEEDSRCQSEIANKYFLPSFSIDFLTTIVTKGKGLP